MHAYFKSKEDEVKKMREELSDLRSDESELEQRVEASRKKLDEMKRNFSETSSIIIQVNLHVMYVLLPTISLKKGAQLTEHVFFFNHVVSYNEYSYSV